MDRIAIPGNALAMIRPSRGPRKLAQRVADR
jgi:hypothetical protein